MSNKCTTTRTVLTFNNNFDTLQFLSIYSFVIYVLPLGCIKKVKLSI